MRSDHIDALKLTIEQKFSRRILTSADAIELGERVYKITGRKLSSNTIRRVFGLVKSQYLPSYATLDALSIYLGYGSFDDYIKNKKTEVPDPSFNNTPLLQYMEMLFQNISVNNAQDPTYIEMVTQTIAYLKETPEIISRLQTKISKTKNGQEFYFEKLVHLDKLATYYGEGLQYYLDAKNTEEAQIFGHSLLCFKGWLTMNDLTFENHYKEVIKHKISHKANPFVSSRYFAVQFYHAHAHGENNDALIAEVRSFYEKIKPAKNAPYTFPYFEFIISLAMTLVEEYDEALYYSKLALQRKEGIEVGENDKGFYCFFELYIAIALFHKGEKEKTKQLLKNIKPSCFHLLFRQFHTILLLQLKANFQRNKKDREQLLQLVEETGFKRLMEREIKPGTKPQDHTEQK